jgi:predicted alpha/beta-hydrolase family hydrolase
MKPHAEHVDRALLLTPGASATRDHPALVAIEEALAPLGVPVARVDLPSQGSARPAVLIDAVCSEVDTLAQQTGLPPQRIAIGGRSLGGRICSMAVAQGLSALALVLLSYPLHPPGKPGRLRIEHLPAIQVPCLFVSSGNDPFGAPDELESATSAIPGPVTHVWMDGGGHGLRGRDRSVAEAVQDWLTAL